MKKALAIILSICFLLCLTACNKDETASDITSDNSQITSTENHISNATDSSESTETINSVISVHTHSYSNATCTEAFKCSCGATNGSALGHNYSEATCTDAKKCTRCGTTDGSALGHNYDNGVCSRCGNKDSNYVEYVTVPNFIGLTKGEAEKLATSNNIIIKVEIEKEYFSDYSDETIIRQSHPTDSYVKKGTTIIVYKNPPIENLFNLALIDETTSIIGGYDKTGLTIGTYVLTSLNGNNFPSVLRIPAQYNGAPVTAVYGNLLDGKNIETIVFPATIKFVGSNLCGGGCNCPNLKKIVCLGDDPFILGSFSLNPSQLNGGCKIYVPDAKVDVYKNSKDGGISFKTYADLIFPISSLDESTKNLIS